MKITISELKPGDFLLWRGTGFLFSVFSLLLSLLDTVWRKRRWKPWHLGIAWERSQDTCMVLEATGEGVELNVYDCHDLRVRCQAYQWLKSPPPSEAKDRFLLQVYGKKYDVVLYFWTMAQYLFRHFWNRRIPRLLDDRFTCWELGTEWAEFMHDPIQSKYDCPMISDIMSALESRDDN